MPSSFAPRRHLSDVLAATARRYPDKAGLVYRDQTLTWRQVNDCATALAKSLVALGIQHGDRIGIFCPPRPEYVVVYMAAARIGAILTGFNIQYTAREITEYGKLVEPAAMFLIADLGVAEQIAPILTELPSIQHTVAIGADVPDGMLSFDQLIGKGMALPDPALTLRMTELCEDDGALIVFTGGTTGTPKPALLSHKNIIVNIEAQNRHVGFSHTDRLIQHLPMNHVSGSVLITVGGMMAGATLYLLDRFTPTAVLALIEQAQITILGQVPTMFAMEFLVPDFARYDLSSLREVIVAGAPTPGPLMRRIAALAQIAIHGYGLTESAGMVSYTAQDGDVDALLRGAGAPPPEVTLRLVDDARCPTPDGEIGEIALQSACVMLGYFGDPAATAEQIDADGWLYTGDLGRILDDGSLQIVGRRKEMYISGGYNVYPAEVEAYVLTHPDVAACACIGRLDPVMGEVGMIFAAPKPGRTLRGKELRAYCKTGLARYKNPRYVQIIDALPVTPAGKVDKIGLQRRYLRAGNGANGASIPGHVPASS